MKIVFGSVGPKSDVEALVLLVCEEDTARDRLVVEVDAALGGALRSAMKDEDFSGKKDTQLTLPAGGMGSIRRVLLIGLGPRRKLGPAEIHSAFARASRWANDRGGTTGIVLPSKSKPETVRWAAEGAVLGTYRFAKYLTGDRMPKKAAERIVVGLHPEGAKAGARAAELASNFERGLSVGHAVNLVRDLVNEPPNELTPAALAHAAAAVAKKHKLKFTSLDRKGIAAAGMKLLDAVGQGSSNEPRFVHMVYTPTRVTKRTRRVAIVGKGLTFDSGGLCIKPAQGMGDMKCDMAGAAVTIGAMAAIAGLQLDVEVHGIFAAAENMPDGNAYRPGDIFGSLDGKTVEIINTDAEGRLVLADALTFARKLEPDIIVDHATLTGACVVALGPHCAGLYASDTRLARRYLGAAERAGELLWHLPLLEGLRETLKSDVADLKHTGERYGGSITAALFLREFVGDCAWMHLDIAGPAFSERASATAPKGATGFGVMTFVRFLESLR